VSLIKNEPNSYKVNKWSNWICHETTWHTKSQTWFNLAAGHV